MSVELAVALWLVLSAPFAIVIGTLLSGDGAPTATVWSDQAEVVGLDGDKVILRAADGTLERTPLTIGI